LVRIGLSYALVEIWWKFLKFSLKEHKAKKILLLFSEPLDIKALREGGEYLEL
jgi:hypothetical protein